MTILDMLAAHARERVAAAKQQQSLEQVRRQALSLPKGNFVFKNAIAQKELSFICECKKASPSKGLIVQNFPYLEIAQSYERGGADCISVLTEPKWFLGSDKYLEKIAKSVKRPCLRKDFVVDEYMLYEAKLLGASAVLLICKILSTAQLREYLAICNELGLSVLVEVHNEHEIERALSAGAQIIGVNNRNLEDFTVDMQNSCRLRKLLPPDILFVAESGIKNKGDVQKIRSLGADAVLIGEALMRADNIEKFLQELKNG